MNNKTIYSIIICILLITSITAENISFSEENTTNILKELNLIKETQEENLSINECTIEEENITINEQEKSEQEEISNFVSNFFLQTIDSESPTINLSFPEDKIILDDSIINFEFTVEDNIEVSNCTFRIYNASHSSNDWSKENSIYTEILEQGDFTEGSLIEIEKEDFIERAYAWEVECVDNSSIHAVENRFFEVNFSNFTISNVDETYLINNNGDFIDTGKFIFEFPSTNSLDITITRPDSSTWTKSYTTNTELTLNNTLLNQYGNYTVKAIFNSQTNPITVTKDFTVSKLTFTYPEEAKENEEIEIYVKIESPKENIRDIVVYFMDGHTSSMFNYDTPFVEKEIEHTYEEVNDFQMKISFKIGDKTYNNILGEIIEITSEEDSEDPEIDLIFPANEQTLSSKTITFEFEVDDNIKIDSCNLSIYNVTYSSGLWTYREEDKVYTEELEDSEITEGQEIEITLTDFEERDYSWEVECIDNSSNYKFETNYFTIADENETILSTTTSTTTLNYTKQAIVEELIIQANDFIAQENLFKADEKKALEDIGLLDKIKLYKKRLVQIDQDLKHNIKFIVSTSLKEQRIKELNEEIDSIEGNIPSSIEIKDTHEYVKTSINFEWENLINSYLNAKNIKLSTSLKKIIFQNQAFQQKISTATTAQELEITYPSKTENLIIVNKKIDLYNNASESILEVIPSNLIKNNSKIEFLSEVTEIKNGEIYSFNFKDLENGELIYQIKEDLTTKDIEKTDTILFSETYKKTKVNTISGFSVFGGFAGEESIYLWLIVFLILILGGLFAFVLSKAKSSLIKKDPNAFKILDLIEQIKRTLKEEEITNARNKYSEIKEVYPILNNKIKKGILPSIKKALVAIDKKDIYNLVNEYKIARKESRKSDAINLYEKIKKIYKRLPKKDQENILNQLK